MQKWRYWAVSKSADDDTVVLINGKPTEASVQTKNFYSYLDELGQSGWEMVGLHSAADEPLTAFFKRPLL